MSRKHHKCKREEEKNYGTSMFGNFGNCCCSFPTLIILILIILQFNRGRRVSFISGSTDDCEDDGITTGRQLIDNSILFIIALFFLACCNPCKRY